MQKIKIITDSASDISCDYAEKYNIDVIGFHIVLKDKQYRECEDITTEQFYSLLESSDELPHTSQITVEDYLQAYKKHIEEGYTDIINVVISSTGSNSFNNANMARDLLFEENKMLSQTVKITILDSRAYTGAYGFPVIEAAKKIQKGDNAETVIAFLEDWFDSAVVVCTTYTLKYARKSGRVGCVAAFVGEVLGLKPIITFIDAVSDTVDKVRGTQGLVPKLVEVTVKRMVPQTPYAILVGSNRAEAYALADAMTKQVGYKPTEYLQVGATISCHLGCQVLGVVIKGEKRR